MQWLTAILAFATTMLVFSMVVSALVETIHRILRSRTGGLKRQLAHFYDQVLSPQLNAAGVQLKKQEFIDQMTLVRAPTSNFLISWMFRRLTNLPTPLFMERLGSTSFADVQKGNDVKRKQLLKDIAQKYETFGAEASRHFESWARLWSVAVAMLVAWTFYVQPYDLIQAYLSNPEAAGKVAALADGSLERYEDLVQQAAELRRQPGQAENEELAELIKQLSDDLEAARMKVNVLSQAGAPLGWPDDAGRTGTLLLYEAHQAKQARQRREKSGAAKQQNEETGLTISIYYPKRARDIFWLLVGGLLVGLGAPFWARMISQMTQAKGIAGNLAAILKPQTEPQKLSAQGASTADDTPLTTEAFLVSADARC